MRIHVSYAGGTIGEKQSADGLVPGADLQGWLFDRIAGTSLENNVSFSEFDPLIDSSNATPLDWQAIADDITAHSDDADAFVVLHGTDTMAYSSAAVAFALPDIGKPVIFTGAQRPFEASDSDAGVNVDGAFAAALSGHRGVSLYFCHKLLAGVRAAKVSSWSDAGFDSPNYPPLATDAVGEQLAWSDAKDAPATAATIHHPKPYGIHDIAVVNMCPGISAGRVSAYIGANPEGVIIRGLGVGNGPTDPAVVDVIRDVASRDIPVVMTSQCVQASIAMGTYGTGNAYVQAGVIGAADMTFEATYAKMVFLLSQGLLGHDVRTAMMENIAGELDA